MSDYQRKTFRWGSGVQVNAAVDAISPERLAFTRNVRAYQFEGGSVIQPRPGQTAVNATPIADLNVHTIGILNNDLPTASQAYAQVIGAGSVVYSDNAAHNAFTQRATGFDGAPLCLVTAQPDQSPEPFMYIGDGGKMGKMKVDGTFRNMGVVPPGGAPTGAGSVPIPNFPGPTRITVDTLSSAAGFAFVNGGATILTSSTFIENILYDSGSSGWASVNITTFDNAIDEGVFLTFTHGASSEAAVVEQVLKAMRNGTVSSIAYDAGTTGLCTIVLSHNARHRTTSNALLNINGEIVRVLNTSIGPDDLQSIRCSTVNPHAVGDAVTGLLSFRVYLTGTYVGGGAASGDTVSHKVFKLNGVASGLVTATKTSTLDLSNINGRPVQDTDEININVAFFTPASTTEVQILLDCDQNTNDFTQNFFYKALRPSDIVPSTQQTQTSLTVKQTKAQRTLIDATDTSADEMPSAVRDRLKNRLLRITQAGGSAKRIRRLQARIDALDSDTSGPPPNPTSDVGVAGSTQYVIFRFKISELIRVGSDSSVGLKDIKAIRLLFTATDIVSVGFAGWWIGGTFGPDVGDVGTPYIYRFRYRASESGAKSLASPATRSGVLPHRQRVQLVAAASGDAQVDKIDWFRFGGSLNIWKYIGTGPNSTATFNDDFPDDVIASNPGLEFDDYQPFPVVGIPITGTCNASGTTVTVTSGAVSLSMAPGTEVIINGISCTTYAPPLSTTKFEIVENIGALTGVSLFIPQPLIMGQALPALFGPFGQGFTGMFLFACGSTGQEGTLFWTKGNNPDNASDTAQLDVTSPSEPLMNGCVLGSRAYVFSSEQLYEIIPSAGLAASDFITQSTPCGMGLFARYGLTVGSKGIYFVAKDGIYRTSGGAAESITDRDLYPLFPHDGQAGVTTNGIVAPDFTAPNNLRLECGDQALRFDYLGIDGMRYTLVYDEMRGTWDSDKYAQLVIASHYREGRGMHGWLLGANNGKVYSLSGTSDDGTAIACEVRSGSFDMGDSRATKVFGDVIVDFDPDTATLTAQIGFDNYGTLPASTALVTTAGRRQQILDVNSGVGAFARNIAMDVSWSSATRTPRLYLWEPAFFAQPESIQRRRTDFTDLGYNGPKFFQGLRLTADTFNAAKSILVQADNGANGVATTNITLSGVQHDGHSTIDYAFNPPFIAHLVRLLPNDATTWELFGIEWLWQPDSPLVTFWETQPLVLADSGYGHARDGYLGHISTADITLTLIIDGVTYNYTVANSGGTLAAKTYVPFQAIKGKTVQWRLTSSAGFRVYKKMSEMRCKSWGESGPYRVVNPFGEFHDSDGARI